MRTILLLAGLTLSTIGTASFPEPAQANDAVATKVYTDFLAARGIESTVDSDGDVQFKITRGERTSTMILFVDSKDPTFFRIVLPNIWPIESIEERARVLRAANDVTRDMKVAKAYVVDDNVWIAVELFVPGPAAWQAAFDRVLTVIEEATITFVKQINKGR